MVDRHAWFDVDHDLPEKPEVLQIMSATGTALDACVGRLVLFWRWVDRHAKPKGDGSDVGRLLGCNVQSLIRQCGGDERFWDAVAMAGWLRITPEAIEVPGWGQRFAPSAKNRRREAKRQKQYRDAVEIPAAPEPSRTVASPPVPKTTTATPPASASRTSAAFRAVLAQLEEQHLPDTKWLIRWVRDLSQAAGSPIEDTDYYRLRIVAAAERAIRGSQASKHMIRRPAAFVACCVRDNSWTKLEPEDLSAAERRLGLTLKRAQTPEHVPNMRDQVATVRKQLAERFSTPHLKIREA